MNDRPPSTPTRLDGSPLGQCACGTPIRPDASFCPSCGVTLHHVTPVPQALPSIANAVIPMNHPRVTEPSSSTVPHLKSLLGVSREFLTSPAPQDRKERWALLLFTVFVAIGSCALYLHR